MSLRLAENVTRLSNGVNERTAVCVELLPNVVDVSRSNVHRSPKIVMPDVIDNLIWRKHTVRVQEKQMKEIKFCWSKAKRVPRPPDLVSLLVHCEIGKTQGRLLLKGSASS